MDLFKKKPTAKGLFFVWFSWIRCTYSSEDIITNVWLILVYFQPNSYFRPIVCILVLKIYTYILVYQ